MRRIVINKIRCKKCCDVIESTHRHDFKYCRCGAVSIDGGTDYQKVGWGADRPGEALPVEDYVDFSYSRYTD